MLFHFNEFNTLGFLGLFSGKVMSLVSVFFNANSKTNRTKHRT